MSKKVRANREFSDIFELAAYLNYYFSKNEDASISMNDIKKIVDNNPNFSMEEPTIGNTALRPVISDNEGHTLMLEMKPSFVVYEDDCEDEEPEDEDEETEEESDEEEETDEDGRKIDKNILEQFDWVKPGEEFLWHEPETDEEVPVVCDAVISKSGKVQSETTEITVHRRDEDQEDKFNIFCDEIVLEDSDEESDEEIEDAEIVDESEESEDSEDKDDE